MIAIRPVRPEDVAAVRAALAESWRATYDPILGPDAVRELTEAWHDPRTLARQAADPAAAFLLAEREGRVLGSVYAHVDEAGAACLRRLYLVPSARGEGIGKRLLDAALAALGERPAWLEVEPRNEAAIRFYAREGFVAQPARDGCGGRAELRAVVMRRGPLLRARPVEDRDAQDLFGLVTLCFAEYPGCFVDPHGDMPDLVRPATHAGARGARFWAVEDRGGRVRACVSMDMPEPGVAELHRLYVRPDERRKGIAAFLVGLVEREAREGGARRLILWSDTRFRDAHRLYERLGYVRTGRERDLGDVSRSRELQFEKAL